jgi:acetyl esterase/lipase
MLTKSTIVYANHQLPLECDVYHSDDYPTSLPVVLFFHSGGLVGGARTDIPVWLAQVREAELDPVSISTYLIRLQACIARQWPLISASYRLLPQAKASGLLEDVTAAYNFAKKWGVNPEASTAERKVIVAGASAGKRGFSLMIIFLPLITLLPEERMFR